jgi:hypothetical protein
MSQPHSRSSSFSNVSHPLARIPSIGSSDALSELDPTHQQSLSVHREDIEPRFVTPSQSVQEDSAELHDAKAG